MNNSYQELIIIIFIYLCFLSFIYLYFYRRKSIHINLKKNKNLKINKNLKMNSKKKVIIPKVVELSTPLYLPNIDLTIFNRKDIQKPWCQNWNNEKSNLKCFVNKHLQRKCFWSCGKN